MARRSRNATLQSYCKEKNSRRGGAVKLPRGSEHLGVLLSTARALTLSLRVVPWFSLKL
jgi:hypothetical protein